MFGLKPEHLFNMCFTHVWHIACTISITCASVGSILYRKCVFQQTNIQKAIVAISKSKYAIKWRDALPSYFCIRPFVNKIPHTYTYTTRKSFRKCSKSMQQKIKHMECVVDCVYSCRICRKIQVGGETIFGISKSALFELANQPKSDETK